MFEINPYSWAMVELNFNYDKELWEGQLWWSVDKVVLFKKNDGQWYEVDSYEGDIGIDININSLKKILNSNVKEREI